jgi:hypothetical protein
MLANGAEGRKLSIWDGLTVRCGLAYVSFTAALSRLAIPDLLRVSAHPTWCHKPGQATEMHFYSDVFGRMPSWLLVRKRTIPTERILVPAFVVRGVSRGQCGRSPVVVNLSFLNRSRYFFFHVASHLSSRV